MARIVAERLAERKRDVDARFPGPVRSGARRAIGA